MLDRHGIAAYAVSYDPVEVLARFARAYGVAYPLLADPQSEVIWRLGVLNTLIPPEHRWHGVPYPGTLLVDGAGWVCAKSYYPAHGVRDSIARLLEDGFGVAPEAPGVERPVRTAQTAELMATATLSAGTMRPGQVHTFALTLAARPGQEAVAALLLADPSAAEVTFAPVEGVGFGPVAAAAADGRLVLRAPVTAARRREDFTIEATVRLRGEQQSLAGQELSLSLPVRHLPNAAPAP